MGPSSLANVPINLLTKSDQLSCSISLDSSSAMTMLHGPLRTPATLVRSHKACAKFTSFVLQLQGANATGIGSSDVTSAVEEQYRPARRWSRSSESVPEALDMRDATAWVDDEE
ncbi:hypothetical protein GX50_02695 [[Emmonsia] crescens]|uniref:Uncharacterized protein n=1 Tax=[Emmonsia] crescens TaxID=73230 RepID=A0A2B7ZND1_9EURO|nr:hypothetical protein GX50_02695 [Emmonsia crescens]